MKKTIALVIAVLLSVGYSAQSQAKFRIGPRLGLNVNKMHFDGDLFKGDNRAGFTGGVQAEYWLPVVGLGVDLSLMYSYMDSHVNVNKTGSDTDEVYNQLYSKPARNFLEIPLNVKYKFNIPVVNRILAPYIFTGPAVAIKLDGEKDYSNTQWVWNLGVGLELINHLQISAGYGFGMNNAVDGKTINLPVLGNTTLHSTQLKAKNSYWTITAAWMF